MARTSLASALAVACWLAVTPALAVVPPIIQPNWSQLTPDQQKTLAPLAGEWDAMSALRRTKWLGISQRYAKMTPDEQARVQKRMRDWARLSADERKTAREKYKTLKNASPERKQSLKEKWQEYSELPPEEKARLKAEAARTKPAAPPARTPRPTSPPPPATPGR